MRWMLAFHIWFSRRAPLRQDGADAVADQRIRVRQQAGDERIGERRAGDRGVGRRRRLTEIGAGGDRRSAAEIARARTDAAAARGKEDAVAGAEDGGGRNVHAKPTRGAQL